jgi:glycosyltransferase involved in cell wall biosynthesis
MRFAILTTTYKRPIELVRAIQSVRSQTHSDYIHYIVNDSPSEDYTEAEKEIIHDSRIVYLKNENNIGKNKSLNIVLEKLRNEQFSGYLVFLDDDDWLSPECLSDFKDVIEMHKESQWFISNRVFENGESITKSSIQKNKVKYLRDYLVLKRFDGDATHCISSKIALLFDFPKTVKNGEEWVYFSHIAKMSPYFIYSNKPGTITQGYDSEGVSSTYTPKISSGLFKEILSNNVLGFYTGLYIIKRLLSYQIKRLL